jgi:hypothetical protein
VVLNVPLQQHVCSSLRGWLYKRRKYADKIRGFLQAWSLYYWNSDGSRGEVREARPCPNTDLEVGKHKFSWKIELNWVWHAKFSSVISCRCRKPGSGHLAKHLAYHHSEIMFTSNLPISDLPAPNMSLRWIRFPSSIWVQGSCQRVAQKTVSNCCQTLLWCAGHFMYRHVLMF